SRPRPRAWSTSAVGEGSRSAAAHCLGRPDPGAGSGEPGDLPDGVPSAAASRSAPAQRSPDPAGLDEAAPRSTSTELEADMKNDSLMRRLRAARPVAAEAGNHDALFAQIVAEPGDPRLVQAPRERSSGKVRSWTRARPRLLAGSTLGLAGIGAALV